MKTVASLGLLTLAGISCAEGVLASFEARSESLPPGLEVVRGNASLVTSDVTHGNRALRLDFNSYNQVSPSFHTVFARPFSFVRTGVLTLDVTNLGTSPSTTVTLQMVDANGRKAQRDFKFKPNGRKRIGLILSDRSRAQNVYMHNWPTRIGEAEARQPVFDDGFDLSRVKKIGLLVPLASTSTRFVVDRWFMRDPFKFQDYMRAGLDGYGQRRFGDQTGLVHVDSDADLVQRLLMEKADFLFNPPPADRRPNGALDADPLVGTGYFRAEKLNGKWWLVDPEGYLFFSTGLDGVDAREAPTVISGKENMFTSLPSANSPDAKFFGTSVERGDDVVTFNFARLVFERKYGNEDVWWEHQLDRLKSWGFNTIGSWSDENRMTAQNGRVPYLFAINSVPDLATFRVPDGLNDMPDVFDPGFVPLVTNHVARSVVRWNTAGDPMLIGYTNNNELPWRTGPSALGLPLGVLRFSSTELAAKARLVAMMQDKYVTIAALNTAWNTSFTDWAEFSGSVKLNSVNNKAVADLRAYVGEFARIYFATWSAAFRAADPNHLYLGCRMSHNTPEVLWAARPFVDGFLFTENGLSMVEQGGGLAQYDKPAMLSEYTRSAFDRNNTADQGTSLETQADRVEALTRTFNKVVDNPHMVGLHFYRAYDDPVLGSTYLGTNYNFGMIDVVDSPYPELVQMFRALNATIYSRRR